MKRVPSKKLLYIVYVFLFILLLYALAKVQLSLSYSAKHLKEEYYFYCILSSLLFSCIGFLSAKQWLCYFFNVNKSINVKLLAIGLLFLAFGLIPVFQWIIWLRISANLLEMIVQSTYANHAINMLAGLMIGKSFR